jgi:hypothetical protein
MASSAENRFAGHRQLTSQRLLFRGRAITRFQNKVHP